MHPIVVQNMFKNYGSFEILKNINLSINDGEFVSIMGPSGSGKSTLLYILGGLENQTKGKVLINDKEINSLKDKPKSILRCNEIGFVFQFFNLVQNLTVEENIILPAVMSGKKSKDLQSELNEILAVTGLENKKKMYPSQLSGGQQQRVAVARAVINQPKLILADEPTGNLDSKSGEDVMSLMKKINKERGTTVVQVTHNPEMSLYGNRVIRIQDGKIILDEYI
ncbi:ABC transporter ATP-binding protein [Lysinibacillus xylanilyticus]|uniref:ABC transporter ATP-binding protein n=1 Tax=Lysinibacillus xylanilyticus TaxID=582475 RepID=UPI002E1A1D63|nr:ABC transporter ATP-binding protein [Lysinibacillus xylanilyticus]